MQKWLSRSPKVQTTFRCSSGQSDITVCGSIGSGLDTPCSEPGYSAMELRDGDWESEPDDFYSTPTRQVCS